MTSVLVLGAGGMAGSVMAKYLSSSFDVTPWYRKDYNAPDPIPDLSEFDAVVNCIGIIKQKTATPEMMYAVNSEFPYELSKHCKKLFHISSDCVFSGKIPEAMAYLPNDNKDAEDDYGKSKAKGEIIHGMVLRTSIIGPSKDSAGLFEWFRNTKDNPVKGFSNHWWSGITTLELAKIVGELIENNSYTIGVRQIASEKISKLHLLHLINSTFNLGKEIVPVKASESINRVLMADIQAKPLAEQMYELKKYMK